MDFSKFNKITTFIFDVDGVLSDGMLTIDTKDLTRSVSARDGMAIRLATQTGYNVAIITGGKSPLVEERFLALGIQDYHGSCWNKGDKILELMESKNLKKEEVLFCGDDINDFHALQKVGISACPNNAANDILNLCDYICSVPGGAGCAREVIEKVMRIQDKWKI